MTENERNLLFRLAGIVGRLKTDEWHSLRDLIDEIKEQHMVPGAHRYAQAHDTFTGKPIGNPVKVAP